MNKAVEKILGTNNLPTDTRTIGKAAWDAGIHTGEKIGQKTSDIIDDIVDFIFGEDE